MNRALSRRAMLLAAAGGALLAAIATAPAQQPAPAAPNQTTIGQITIDNFAFSPAVLTVTPGTKVVWVNHDEEPHTVMSTDKTAPFKSGALDTNDQFSFVFSQPGTYKYFCTIHSHMVGTVVVK